MSKFTYEVGGLGKFEVDYISEDFTYEDLKEIVKGVKAVRELKDVGETGFEMIGNGSSARVFGYKNYAIKILRDNRKFGDSRDNDVEVLKALKHLEYLPDIKAVIDDNVMIMERIYGITVEDYLENEKYYKRGEGYYIDINFAKAWDETIVSIIANGYLPHDLHNANVMIRKGVNKPVIVDTGWFEKHNKRYNLTSKYDVEKVKSCEEYNIANRWAGDSIKRYLGIA